MSKEKIMEEFEKMMIMTSRIPDSERVFGFDMKSNKPLKNWLSNALNQVRLETIREENLRIAIALQEELKFLVPLEKISELTMKLIHKF